MVPPSGERGEEAWYNQSMSLLKERWIALLGFIHQYKRILIAFSGGCDSTFLLAAAIETLGSENVLAVTAVSPSLPEKEKKLARDLADHLGARYQAIETQELSNPLYAANPTNRCYFCKDELFEHLAPIARENRMALADGFSSKT